MSGLGDMGHLLKQAQEMQRQIDRVRQDLSGTQVEGLAGGGVLRIELSADRRTVGKVTFTPEVLRSSDEKLLGELVQAALQDAFRRAEETEKEAIERVTGGLHLPGLF